jgi:hypothetical protein
LVTSLLDPSLFPASELANLYHMRWDIEICHDNCIYKKDFCLIS